MSESAIRQRTTSPLFNQRFLLGVYAPIILEFIVYGIYTLAKGAEFNWGFLLWALMLFAPALFLYMVSPMIIYFVSGVGNFYKKNLMNNIDSLFIFSDDEEGLSNKQKEKVYQEIEKQLVPQLVKQVRILYIDSYISRSRNSKKENLLSSFETLFLFSITWSILSLADFIGVIILHFSPISLDFIVIDRIDNAVNVIIFALIFATLTILSDILAYYSIGRLRKLMLDTLPIVVHVDEEERINRMNYIRAISQFPIDSIINDRVLRKHPRRIDRIYEQEYSDHLTEALQVYARNQVAKQQAWRIYKPILDELKVPAKQAAVIKDRFFDSPLYDIARDVFSYDHEVNSMKTDIEYVKNRLKLWDEISEEERATALVFLFRSSEQLFKSMIERFDAPLEIYTNFSMILQFLKDKGIITDLEENAFNIIRKKRNTLVHQSGRLVKIEKKEIEDFLQALEETLLKVDEQVSKG
ncbi:MAG: hypothetical protein FK734_11940 [Asgard group archaeon]|nr:hypothetical protein [Asgard group archaeon]